MHHFNEFVVKKIERIHLFSIIRAPYSNILWNDITIKYIYNQLAHELKLTNQDKLKRFDPVKEETGGLYSMRNGKLNVQIDADDPTRIIGETLFKVLLNNLELQKLDDIKLYSFDLRTGFNGSEEG